MVRRESTLHPFVATRQQPAPAVFGTAGTEQDMLYYVQSFAVDQGNCSCSGLAGHFRIGITLGIISSNGMFAGEDFRALVKTGIAALIARQAVFIMDGYAVGMAIAIEYGSIMLITR